MTAGSERNKHLLGAALFLALLIGGGTASGLVTDAIIQAVVVAIGAIVLSGRPSERVDAGAKALFALILLAVLLQIVPVPAALVEPFRPDALLGDQSLPLDDGALAFISLDVGRTVESALYAFTVIVFTFGLLTLRADQVYAMLPYFLVGLACHVIAGALQFSWQDNVRLEGVLPFAISAGIFANVNHFSTLMYSAIPLLVFLGRQRPLYSLISVVLVLTLLLAAGSRAGVIIGVVVSLLSFAMLYARSQASFIALITIFLLASVYCIAAWSQIDISVVDPDFGRTEFARNTIEGITETWLLGVGYGNFERAYQIYEDASMIFSSYVNHAHNDYLELAFEGGVMAMGIMAMYFGLLVMRVPKLRNSPFQKAALLSVIFMLIHSFVDYPLRTLALAMTFGYLNAILFHTGFARQPDHSDVLHVDHDGHRHFVPIDRGR